MPYAEIAQALAVSEVTARWRVCKARQALLARLQAD
jgi:DNA-directed RNA polymerase specialized sigma24 family protein